MCFLIEEIFKFPGSPLVVTLFWSHDHFDPENGDTYPLQVVGKDLAA